MSKKKELARILRAMPPESFPEDVIATYDKENNLVCYNKEIFDTLPYVQKRQVYYLNQPYLAFAKAPTTTSELDGVFNF